MSPTDGPGAAPDAGPAGRSSFSSIRETTDDGLAQAFTQTSISSLAVDEGAILDDGSAGGEKEGDEGEFVAPLTSPSSRLHAIWSPSVAGLRSWKQIHVRGRMASRSFEDLRLAPSGWDTDAMAQQQQDDGPAEPEQVAGTSRIEMLPPEVLAAIIDMLVVEAPPKGIATRNKDLVAVLLTSRTLHQSTLAVLYSHITIPHSRIFRKFLDTIALYPALGAKVRRIDFSHFNPSSLFVTATERSRATNLTAATLSQCLDLTPCLQEFLAQEHVDDDLGPAVLRKLFFGLDRIQALDFAGCSSTLFTQSFSAILPGPWPADVGIRRLSLHKCLTLPSAVFEAVLPRLGRLTHLDVAATRITDAALESIPRTARLTHLNVAKCKLLSAPVVTSFVANHPAARSLVFLSLAADAASHELLDADAVSALLPVLPTTLRSLSIKGSKMEPEHAPLLEPLTRHLEELAVGRRIHVSYLQPLFRGGRNTVRYLDLTDLGVDELSIGTTFSDPASLLNADSLPLEVIELAENAHVRLARSAAALSITGWTTKELGARAWLVRLPADGSGAGSHGHRAWKMGAESWGMRKIPVGRAEVGGMYGSFMFGRKL